MARIADVSEEERKRIKQRIAPSAPLPLYGMAPVRSMMSSFPEYSAYKEGMTAPAVDNREPVVSPPEFAAPFAPTTYDVEKMKGAYDTKPSELIAQKPVFGGPFGPSLQDVTKMKTLATSGMVRSFGQSGAPLPFGSVRDVKPVTDTPTYFESASFPAMGGEVTNRAAQGGIPAAQGAMTPMGGTIAVSEGGRKFEGVGGVNGRYTGGYSGERTGMPGGERVSTVGSEYFTGGPSLPISRELSAAREAAADRGDWKSVEYSYLTPEQKQAQMQVSSGRSDLGAMTLPQLIGYKMQQKRQLAEQKLAAEAEQGRGTLAASTYGHQLTANTAAEKLAFEKAQELQKKGYLDEYLKPETTPERRKLLGPLVGAHPVAGFPYSDVQRLNPVSGVVETLSHNRETGEYELKIPKLPTPKAPLPPKADLKTGQVYPGYGKWTGTGFLPQ